MTEEEEEEGAEEGEDDGDGDGEEEEAAEGPGAAAAAAPTLFSTTAPPLSPFFVLFPPLLATMYVSTPLW